MPDYNNYIMTTALLYGCKKALTKTQVLDSIKKIRPEISRDITDHILYNIENRFALSVLDNRKNTGKCYYSLKKAGANAPDPKDTLMPCCLLAEAFRAYGQKKGSPDLQKNLKKLFAERKIKDVPYNSESMSVYSIMQIEKIISVLQKMDSVSVGTLHEIVNSTATEDNYMSKKSVRRIIKEVTAVFPAEISGRHEHYVRLIPEFKIKLFEYLTPENILELYKIMYSPENT